MSDRNYDKLAVAAEQNREEKNYWLDKLAGDPVKSSFFYDHRESAADDSPAGMDTVKLDFNPDIAAGLMKLSKGSDVKLHMILAAALTVLLEKYTRGSDILIASPIYKQDVEIEFLNTVLVLRNQIQTDMTFKDLLLAMRRTVTDAVRYQNYPLEILQEQLGMPLESSLFDVVLFHENIHDKKYLRYDYINYNILFSFKRTGGQIEGEVEYNPRLYEKTSIQRVSRHFYFLLEQVLSQVDTPLSQIDILSEEETRRFLHDFNSNRAEYPEVKTLHQWFEAQVAQTPDRVALLSEELLRDFQLTYRELNKRANRLARFLRSRGAGPGSIVGLMVEKSLEMMIGILGILKAGCAYLPIDLAYPARRIQYMLKDSSARMLVTYGGNTVPAAVEAAKNPEMQLELIDIFSSHIYREGAADLENVNSPGDAAYIIYTSGSTGKPKGVVVEHRNVIAYVTAFYREFDITGSDIALQQASYSFDVFVEEVFPLLFRGGKTVLCPRYVLMDTAALSRFILNHGITFISVSPLMLNEIDKLSGTGSIRVFISGGDVLKKEYIANLLQKENSVVYNTYGPTEGTVCAAYHRCTTADKTHIPIGKPIANYNVYILDKEDKLVPVGVPGELCISGPGVARGYLNRPELSNQKFLRGPGAVFSKRAPGIYKTGDLARWLPGGEIEFLGRIDQQVKIRGFRVELGEIESFLIAHPGIRAALVSVKETGGNIYAYIESGEELT
ncbi:MAG: amino acid adenylation domain-containing protein, partial [bacterium]|nr:amino acid adenylation domain-containing protein [bacterium]